MLAPDSLPPTIHALHWPSSDVRRGQPVRFFVRTFRTRQARGTWDFGDGSHTVTVCSRTVPDSLHAAGEYAETRNSF